MTTVLALSTPSALCNAAYVDSQSLLEPLEWSVQSLDRCSAYLADDKLRCSQLGHDDLLPVFV